MFPSFEPHPLLRGGNRQTVAAAYLWRHLPYRARRVVVDLHDGDQLVLHDDCPESWQVGQRVTLLIHGLAGCHGSGYMQRIAEKLVQRNQRVFRMDLRGCGAGALRARRSVHAGRTDDVLAAILAIGRKTDDSPLTCVGFSLGASILLKLLGQLGDQAERLIQAGMAVSAPLDLSKCSRLLRRGPERWYDQNFVRRLVRDLEARRRAGVPLLNADWTRMPRSLYDFDAQYTAPMGGYESVEHYYESSSCVNQLADIRVPTHLLHANDDPLIPGWLYDQAAFSESTTVHRTNCGGHLGFLASSHSTDPDWYWMDWRVLEFLERPVILTATARAETG